jgi:tetratricopeptide (TPR) repeat protein
VRQVREDEVIPPRRLQPRLSRDLDTICACCLQKDQRKRYATAQALADDLHRFLAGEPIRARRVGPVVRLAKWARRRRALAALVAVSIAAALALLVGGAVFTWKLEKERTRANTAATVANLEAEKARRSLELLRDPFDEPIGIEGPIFRATRKAGEGRTVVALLRHGMDRMDRLGAFHPKTKAALLDTLGSAYRNLAHFDEAEVYLNEAFKRIDGWRDHQPTDLANCYQSLGQFHYERGRLDRDDYKKAKENYEAALDLREAHGSPEDVAETLLHLGWLAMELEDFAEARRRFAELTELHQAKRFPPGRLLAMTKLGRASMDLEDRNDDSIQGALGAFLPLVLGEGALIAIEQDADWKAVLGAITEGVGHSRRAAGPDVSAEEAHRSRVEAAAALRNCDGIIRDKKDVYHYYRVIPLYLLALVLEQDQDLGGAARAYETALEVVDNSVGREFLKAPIVVRSYAQLLRKQDKVEEAHRQFAAVLTATEERFGCDHFHLANAIMVYARFLEDVGDWPRLEEQCARAKDIYEHGPRGTEHRRYTACVALLTTAVQKLGKAGP